MDDSVHSDSKLEVSVSFGRFENDTLSWEKRSSFSPNKSPNKYLEEAGNLSAPGSVAQKKAYFEAHYKKIAARKLEELEQEKSKDPSFLSPDELIKEDYYVNSPEPNVKLDLSGGEKIVKEIDFSAVAEDENVINSHDENEDFVNCERPKIEEAKDEPSVIELGRPELNVEKESVPVVLSESPRKDSKDDVGEHSKRKNGREQEQASALKKGNSKSSARNINPKVTPTKKDRSPVVITKKKTVSSPLTKPLQVNPIPYSKPALMSTPTSASSPLKKLNGSHIPNRDNAPSSLHTSLSLGPTNSLEELSETRKSLIMDRMGDKDIVKRAFKTFQNRTYGLKADEKPSTVMHVSSAALEPKVSRFHTPPKGNIGTRKSSAPCRKTTMAFSPSTVSKSDDKSVKRKEFLKKLEEKSIAREAANAQLSARSRAVVTTEIHQRRVSS